jgi:hypothetical protein
MRAVSRVHGMPRWGHVFRTFLAFTVAVAARH